MARSADQTQLSGPVCLGELPCIGGRHTLVVVTVHHQQRTRRQAMGSIHWTEATELACPLVEAGREPGSAHGADLAGVFEKSPRLVSPVIEVGARAQQGGTRHPRIIGRDTCRY